MSSSLLSSICWEVVLSIIISIIFFILQLAGKFFIIRNRNRSHIDDYAVGLELCTTGITIFICIVVATIEYPDIVPIFSKKYGYNQFTNIAFVLIVLFQCIFYICSINFHAKLHSLFKLKDRELRLKKSKKYIWLSNSLGIMTIVISLILLLLGR